MFNVEGIIVKLAPCIIILDVMIGAENSLDRINDIRLAAEDIPIIFISSFDDLGFKEKAAGNGAMIYLEKPFDKHELLMWVNRYAKSESSFGLRSVNIGAYAINVDTHVLSYKGVDTQTLSNTEFATFKFLYLNKGMLVERKELKSAVWDNLICTDENLNNVIYKLRKYFEKDNSVRIETVRGEGFKMYID